MKKLIFLSIFLILTTPSIFAKYLIIPILNTSIDFNQRTHFIITSKGNDLGFAPELAAITKAMKISEVFKEDQVIILSPEENSSHLNWLKRVGFSKVELKSELLDATRLFNELSVFNKIASIHTYGHSAIPEGIFLDAVGSKDILWYPNSHEPKRLVNHFTEDAFVVLNGCNLGHLLAPKLAKLWRVPVAGAMVGTHFEVLKNSGKYEILGPESEWSKSTQDSFQKKKNCIRGCLRMRPDNYNYNGHYGKYRQGLPFYKFFCSDISEDSCLRTMALSMLANVSSKFIPEYPNQKEYSDVVKEWLCPFGKKEDYENCVWQLNKIDYSLNMSSPNQITRLEKLFSPFKGNTSTCSFQSCYQNQKCHKSPNLTSQCAMALPAKESTSFIDEYLSYIQGFQLLFK